MGSGEDAEGKDGGVDIKSGGEAGGDDEGRDVGWREHEYCLPTPYLSI